jgi:hypothetical protein
MSQESDVREAQEHASHEDPNNPPTAAAIEAGGRFVGQWNRLESTTNWEKGRIICQWREALLASGAPVTEYSDESWAQLVGGVTSQHVGRLRRVFQRFGDVFDQYEGLYWSHFQAALDWDDAEMWLEGAIRNQFSVSQMRGKRWETLGNTGEPPTESEDEAATVEQISDNFGAQASESASARAEQAVVRSPTSDAGEAESDEDDESEASTVGDRESSSAAPRRERLAVQVDDLPDDLADAFEQFKLAIIAHRRNDWTITTPEAVIECLDALRELALAPSD